MTTQSNMFQSILHAARLRSDDGAYPNRYHSAVEASPIHDLKTTHGAETPIPIRTNATSTRNDRPMCDKSASRVPRVGSENA